MNIKNERPPDYLVEMYKSDKQMFKVRRYITDKETKVKGKNARKRLNRIKRKERAKKRKQRLKSKKEVQTRS